LTGWNFGLGLEYQIAENFVIGLDYTMRDLEGRKEHPVNAYDIETRLNTLSLRFAYRF